MNILLNICIASLVASVLNMVINIIDYRLGDKNLEHKEVGKKMSILGFIPVLSFYLLYITVSDIMFPEKESDIVCWNNQK